MEVELTIEGLSCGHCVNTVERLLKEIEGVQEVKVSLPNYAKVVFDENKVNLNQLKEAVNNSEIYKVV